MKDIQYNAVRDYCKPIAEKWVKLMGVSWDRIDLNWSDNYFDMERDGHGRDTLAFCVAQWAYLQASITFSCPRLWEYFDEVTMLPRDPELIQEWIIHEIGHVLVNEMREYDGTDHQRTVRHEERVVTRLARAFAYTHEMASNEGYARGVIEGAANATKAMKESYPIQHDRDGNMYFFLVGDNLQDGISGFGETPAIAAENFKAAVKANLEREWMDERLRNLIDVVWQYVAGDFSLPSREESDDFIRSVRNGAKAAKPKRTRKLKRIK